MKFQSIQSFEKHLQEAYPGHLAPVYLIAAPNEYERKKLIGKITALLMRKDPSAMPLHWDNPDSFDGLFEHLRTRPMLSSFSLGLFDGAEKIKKASVEQLASYCERPSPSSHLVLGTSSFKNLSELYQRGKKEMIVLDLCDEKPWDLQRRMKVYLNDEAAKKKCSLTQEAATALLEKTGGDLALIDQELAKLLCYIGERQKIEIKDVLLLCPSFTELTGWQMSEAIVWKEELVEFTPSHDLSFLLGLIGQVRYHLQQGLQAASSLDSEEQFIRGPSSEKYTEIARRRGVSFFKKALCHLFDLEMASKSGSYDPVLSWQLFQTKLKGL